MPKGNVLYKRPDSFTQVSRKAIQDSRLSWKARGLYAFLVSKATVEGWSFDREWVIKQSQKDGQTSYDSGIKELKDFGYLEIEAIKDAAGKFIGWKWLIYTDSEIHSLEKPNSGKPGFRGTPTSGKPEENNIYREEELERERDEERKRSKKYMESKPTEDIYTNGGGVRDVDRDINPTSPSSSFSPGNDLSLKPDEYYPQPIDPEAREDYERYLSDCYRYGLVHGSNEELLYHLKLCVERGETDRDNAYYSFAMALIPIIARAKRIQEEEQNKAKN